MSCCFIDDIGPIKVSVGVATYPDCAEDKEKLLKRLRFENNNIGYYNSSQIFTYGDYSKIETGGTTVKVSSNGVSAQENGQDIGGVQKITGKNGQEFFVLTNEDGTKGVFDPKSGEFLSENKAKEMGLI